MGLTTRIRRILPWPASKTGALRRVGRGALVVLLRGRPRRDADGHPPCACPSPSSRRAPDGRPPAHERRANARATCDLEGPDHGCSGADWWHDLPYDYEKPLKDLRAFATKFLAQKAQESAAERHYSLTANIQSKNRGSMQPPSLEKRCLLRTEILQEIATGAKNHGLKTADEAAAEDEAAGFTPAL